MSHETKTVYKIENKQKNIKNITMRVFVCLFIEMLHFRI